MATTAGAQGPKFDSSTACCYVVLVKRTQLQLDDATYQEIRQRAFGSGRSMACLMRELLQKALHEVRPDEKETRIRRAWSAVGRFQDPTGEAVSEEHDQFLDS